MCQSHKPNLKKIEKLGFFPPQCYQAYDTATLISNFDKIEIAPTTLIITPDPTLLPMKTSLEVMPKLMQIEINKQGTHQ